MINSDNLMVFTIYRFRSKWLTLPNFDDLVWCEGDRQCRVLDWWKRQRTFSGMAGSRRKRWIARASGAAARLSSPSTTRRGAQPETRGLSIPPDRPLRSDLARIQLRNRAHDVASTTNITNSLHVYFRLASSKYFRNQNSSFLYSI